MPRIALSALQQRSRLTGTGRYIAELFHALPGVGGGDEYLLYAKPDQRRLFREEAGRTRVRVMEGCPSSPMKRVAWEALRFTGELRRDEVDLYHGPANFLPFRKVCPYVLTLHDMVYFHNPGRTFPVRAWYWQASIRATWRHADLILTVSEFSRQQIMKFLPVPPDRIRVILNGVDERFLRDADDKARADMRATHGLAEPYILYVGRLDPDKNVRRLIEAYGDLVARGGCDPMLAIAGIPEYKTSDLPALIARLGITDRVRFLGFVEEENLAALYQEAEAFCFPSLNEGFGLPVLEAMAAGRAVVTSNISSLPEVAGNTGILVDPFSVKAISDGLAEALRRPGELGAAARERARTMTWKQTAARTAEAYREVLEGVRRR